MDSLGEARARFKSSCFFFCFFFTKKEVAYVSDSQKDRITKAQRLRKWTSAFRCRQFGCLVLRLNLFFTEFQFYFFFAKIECGLYFLDRFDVLMLKIIFKKWKNIIGMYFSTKSYLKSNHYHTAKHPFHKLHCSSIMFLKICESFFFNILIFLN
jgi:hypothetical protein